MDKQLPFSQHLKCLFPARYWVLLFALWLPAMSYAADYKILNQTCRSTEDAFVLDANIDFDFSDKVIEALHHGVPITLELHMQVRKQDAWLWEKDLTEIRLRYQISYHALASVYQVLDLQTNTKENFVTREIAVNALGEINSMPVVRHEQMEKGKIYRVGLKTSLDIDALPLPMRPLAYLSPSWNQSSEWRTCRIRR
jgi:hypothetical protein